MEQSSTTTTLPQFLKKKIAFRDATHSESLKGLVNLNNNKASAFVSYTANKSQSAPSTSNSSNGLTSNKSNKSTSSADEARDKKYGFKVASIDIFPRDRLVPFLKWSRIRSIGPGLTNLGNTCFLNSVLQCMLYSTPLAEYLLSSEHSKRCRSGKDEFCGLCVMERLAHRCFSKNVDAAIRPIELVSRIKSIAKQFRPGRQEDSHEFLRYLIESMHKSALPPPSPTNPLDARSKETTPVHRIFGGYLQSTVTCSSCNHVSRTFDHFLDLSLDINKCDSVHAALKLFTAPELLCKGNRYKCEACHRLVDARKQFTIYKTPEVLTLQIKRFSMNPMTGQTGKLNRPVAFPEHLDISTLLSDKEHSEGTQYRLYGVIVHEGHSCNSGHYHAFVKNSNDVWYSMNDCSVHQVSVDTVLRQRAYILLYQKKQQKTIQQHEAKKEETKLGEVITKKEKVEKQSSQNELIDIMTTSNVSSTTQTQTQTSTDPTVNNVDVDKQPKVKKTKEEKMAAILEASRAYTSSKSCSLASAPQHHLEKCEEVKVEEEEEDQTIPQLIDTSSSKVCTLRSNSMWHMTPFSASAMKQTQMPSISKRAKYNFETSWKVDKIN